MCRVVHLCVCLCWWLWARVAQITVIGTSRSSGSCIVTRFLGCGGLARPRVYADALSFYLVFLNRGHWDCRCLYYCGWLLCGLWKTGLCGKCLYPLYYLFRLLGILQLSVLLMAFCLFVSFVCFRNLIFPVT